MPILLAGRRQEKKEEKDSNNESKSVDLDELRSRSLASYVDIRRKARSDQEKKMKKLVRMQEKFKEKERKLRRAQERGAQKLKETQQVLKAYGRDVDVRTGALISEKDRVSKDNDDSLLGQYPEYIHGIMAVWCLTLSILAFIVKSSIEEYGLKLRTTQNKTEEQADAIIDSAQNAALTMALLGLALFLFLGFVAYTEHKVFAKIAPLLFFIFNIASFAVFLISIVFQAWYNDMDNTSAVVFIVMCALATVVGIYQLLTTLKQKKKDRKDKKKEARI